MSSYDLTGNDVAYYNQNQLLDENGEYVEENGEPEEIYYPPPDGHPHDALGRLLKDPEDIVYTDCLPEDLTTFVSAWQAQQLSSSKDWEWTTEYVWPDVYRVVLLKRLDIYQQDSPLLQYGTTDREESIKVRNTGDWYALRTIFFMEAPTDLTCEFKIELAGPPRRSKFIIGGKINKRDLINWTPKEKLYCFQDPHFAKGSSRLFIDYGDLPDRYFISSDPEAGLGLRRLFPFAAYTATQYYILEKRIYHEALDAEGGWGHTYMIEAGNFVYARKDWRLIGSFYGFDHQLPSSCKYTVYRRYDPFPRIHIARETIQNPEQWSADFTFYAFDIPVPGTMRYAVHHCLRSIYTNVASVPRHRLTTEDHRTPWEFRMNLFVFPADLRDCTYYPYDPNTDLEKNFYRPPEAQTEKYAYEGY